MTMNLVGESMVLFPVFVGMLRHATGRRMIVVTGVTGSHSPALTSFMTRRLNDIEAELGGPAVRTVT